MASVDPNKLIERLALKLAHKEIALAAQEIALEEAASIAAPTEKQDATAPAVD